MICMFGCNISDMLLQAKFTEKVYHVFNRITIIVFHVKVKITNNQKFFFL